MRTKSWFLLILSVTLFLHPCYIAQADTPLQATFIDVGQGDSCWLHLPNGDDVLVDGGLSQAGPTVVAYLQHHGVTDIDLMVATHGDADHIGGLLDVLDAMPVQQAWLDSWQTCTTQTCLDFYQALADNSVVTATVRAGESYPLGEVIALVLNPWEPLYAGKNENSVVLRVSYGTVDFLLAGDTETGAEGRMLDSGLPLDAEILKVAHHGSDSSSSPEFLGAVMPQEAIISVGPNTYGHPSHVVTQTLEALGANVFRTDFVGTVIVTTDGATWTVTTTANVPSELGTVTPSSGSGPTGETTAFATTWTDANGWEDLKHCYFHIGDSPVLAGNVTLMYNRAKDKLWLRSDDGTTWIGGHAPGSANTMENSQAIVHCNLTTADGSDDTLSVTWVIEFKPGFTGSKKLGLKCKDVAKTKGRWIGTWTIAQHELTVTHLQYSGPDEYMEITNHGADARDMTGWQIQSVMGDQWYSFPHGYTLAAGGYVRVHSGPDAWSSPPTDLKWTTAYTWNDEGDEAKLYDSHGALVDSWGY